jgi:hypothetical protein
MSSLLPHRSTTTTTRPESDPTPDRACTAAPRRRVATGSTNPRFLLSRLQGEWDQLSHRRATVARVRSWRIVEVEFSDLDAVLSATGLGRRGHDDAWNTALGRLVELAQHDELAARIVLQRLLPGLSATARRRSSGFNGHLDALDELLSVAWSVIRTYRVSERPHYIVAGLLRECEYRAFDQLRRRKLVHEFTEPGHFERRLAATDDLDPMVELAEVVRIARQSGVAEADLEFVALLAQSPTARVAAERLQVTERTVRNHRDAVVHRLRAALLAA